MKAKKKVKNAIVWIIPVMTTVLSVYYIALAFKQQKLEMVEVISQAAMAVGD